MLPHLIITSPQDMSHHFQERFDERVSTDSIDLFVNAVNTGNIFISSYFHSKSYNTVVTYCIYESLCGELYIAIHRDSYWVTILPMEYHLNNLDKLNNDLITTKFLEKLEQYHLTKELCG